MCVPGRSASSPGCLRRSPGCGRVHRRRARRRDIPAKATAILAALRSAPLGQPEAVTAAYAVTARSLIAVITVLNEQVKTLQGQVEAVFGRHPDAEIYLSQPGLGPILGARVLGEFDDDPHRYASGKARKNYAATSPPCDIAPTRCRGRSCAIARRAHVSAIPVRR